MPFHNGFNSHKGKALAVLTSGGDSQGMNAAIRAVVRVGIYYGCKVYFIKEGYQGMLEGSDNIIEAEWHMVSSILHLAGTVIGSARCPEFHEYSSRLKCARNLVSHGITHLVIIGGDGSLTGAHVFREEWAKMLDNLLSSGDITNDQYNKNRYLHIVGLVGSIDNDFHGTDMTIGADSALHRILEATDAIESTAASHKRTFIMEIMGRRCGYLTLKAALATEADFLFIPENPPGKDWPEKLCHKLERERKAGKRLNIIMVCEGAVDRDGQKISSEDVKTVIKKTLDHDTRITVLGHVQRGGNPSAFDRILASRMGAEAVTTLMESDESAPAYVIVIKNNKILRASLTECIATTKAINEAMRNLNWEETLRLRGESFSQNLRINKLLVGAEPRGRSFLQNDTRMSVALVHVGNPAGGMNALTRTLVRYFMFKDIFVYGVEGGVEGFVKNKLKILLWNDVAGLVSAGGTILGSNRTIASEEHADKIAEALEKHKISGLIIVGGFEAYLTARFIWQNRDKYEKFRIPLVVVPATISNNVPGCDFALGADTALNEITQYCDRIRLSAQGTKQRVFIVEVMGGYCGYLTTMGGISSGSDESYVFEEKFNIHDLVEDIEQMKIKMKKNVTRGLILRNQFCNIHYNTDFISRLYQEEGKGVFSTRMNVIGHVQQGGSPSPFDRNNATKLGIMTVEWLISQMEQNDSLSTMKAASDSTAVILGARDKNYQFTPLKNLEDEVDFKYRIAKEQWWMALRPLLAVLAKHPDTYISDSSPTSRTSKTVGKEKQEQLQVTVSMHIS